MDQRTFTATTVDEAWEQFSTDITWQESPNNYRAVINTGKYKVDLETVKSVGGGDEGWGFEQTTFRAALPASNTFKFAITPEDFLNRIGKFFGMQDVKVGYPEFDDNVLVQTNDEVRLKQLFADETLRTVFQNLSGYSFHIDKTDQTEEDHLHLVIQRALTNPADLRRVFSVFYHVLSTLDPR
ncbi:hypothetical protein [Aridibaculum aurantiacum]|uniref:hypothetical protein n=1 Tax=Aridibaculum aurantiacum TaxID=2810307 RepID=UPI001A9765F7|nr:hypothetical protein [Aridibaculum aurantiacum]